jgi:hypothetical protein
MFESQSNTPESAQDNVEVIINSMSGAELAPIMDDLSGQVTELEAEVTRLKSELGIYRDRASDFAKTIGRARDLIQEVLAGDTEAESTFDAFRAPFELLGVSLTREVEVEITVTWRGTIELPHGTDPEDLDIDDFGISEPEHNYHNSYFNMGMHDYDISER